MSDTFTFTLEDIIDIYVTIESSLNLSNLTASAHADERNVKMLLRELKGYSNHEIHVFEEDLYADLGSIPPQLRDLYSKCLVFEPDNAKKRVEVWINSNILPNGDKLVNDCWERFCTVKEACQAILRDEFMARGWQHHYPTTASVAELRTLYGNLVRFKFSMVDFANPIYPMDTKVENAAEILALLLLYPIEKMVVDKEKLVDDVFTDSLFEIANNYKVPRRYVELFLTSPELESIAALIRMQRDGI